MIDTQKTESPVHEPLVSIIIPVYKVENYLDRCVQSIISQRYKNIEVFLVDDGSPDNCGNMCDDYSKQYPYIHVIHQENAGQAAARNNAVRQATGEYICFVDSDDFVESDCIEYLLAIMQNHKADMSIGGFAYLYEGKDTRQRNFDNENVEVLNPSETLTKMNYNQGFGATPWAKLYKKQLVLDHPFPEGQIYEDLATLYKIVGDCKTVALGNRCVYYWVQRVGSTMRKEFDDSQMAGMDAALAQIQYVEEKYPDALPSAKYRHTAKAIELIAICFNSGADKKVFDSLQGQMKIYADDVLKDKYAKSTMKMRVIAVKLGYYPARIVFGLHEKAKKILIH